jgi:hypothetical protein
VQWSAEKLELMKKLFVISAIGVLSTSSIAKAQVTIDVSKNYMR